MRILRRYAAQNDMLFRKLHFFDTLKNRVCKNRPDWLFMGDQPPQMGR